MTDDIVELENFSNWLRLSGLKNIINLDVDYLASIDVLDLADAKQLDSFYPHIDKMYNLKQIILHNCKSLTSLPDSIGYLQNLLFIDLSNSSISALPDSIGGLSSLKVLYLGFTKVTELPDSIGRCTNLVELNLSSCRLLQSIPNSIGNLTQLKSLDLSNCRNLVNFPDSIYNVFTIEKLDISACGGIKDISMIPDSFNGLVDLNMSFMKFNYLPQNIGNLKNLKSFNLEYCEYLERLPDSIAELSSLERLNLNWCKHLVELPATIGDLKNLKELDLKDCSRLEYIPESILGLDNLLKLEVSQELYEKNKSLLDKMDSLIVR
jgi:Leucine-rich repeat (LRR) protein